jgi:hypothetical protein
MMLVQVTLAVNPEDQDPDSGTGLTEAAYDRLSAALMFHGFEIHSGPERVIP